MHCEFAPVSNVANRPQRHRRRRRWTRSLRSTAYHHRHTNQPITDELCSRSALLSLRRGYEHTAQRLCNQLQFKFQAWPTPSVHRVDKGMDTRGSPNKTGELHKNVQMFLRKLSLAKWNKFYLSKSLNDKAVFSAFSVWQSHPSFCQNVAVNRM